MPYFRYFAVIKTLINILKEIIFSKETLYCVIKELHRNVWLFFVCAPWARSNAMSLTLEYFLQKSKFLMMVRKMIVRKKYFWVYKIGRNKLPACCRYVLVELRQVKVIRAILCRIVCIATETFYNTF